MALQQAQLPRRNWSQHGLIGVKGSRWHCPFSSVLPSFFFLFFFPLFNSFFFLFLLLSFFFFFSQLQPKALLSPPQSCECQKVSRLRVYVAFLNNLLLSDPGSAAARGFAKKSPFRK